MQRFILTICVFLFGAVGFGQDTLPKVRDIVKKFYSTYRKEELNPPYISFEKRKNGWFVITQKIEGGELVPADRYLFYNRKTAKYETLPLSKNQGYTEINPGEYMDWYDLQSFDAQIYYGYRGWYKDVISELGNKKALSDDEMNGLARAYSIYAGALLSDQTGFSVKSEIWNLPLSINCLSPGQIEEFNLLEKTAQELFKKLAERNPGYETVVGKIGMKYANEVMYQYTILLAHASDYAMKMKLPSDLYTAEQLEVSRKNLENCPPGAILFSFSDNDYYPVHYLQHALGLRKDVHLINYNLISLDRYIYRATHPQYGSAAIHLSVDTTFYMGNVNDLIYIRDSGFSFMFSDIRWLLTFGTKEDIFGRVTLSADKILLSKDKTVTNDGMTITAGAAFSLKDVRYLIKNQWILLDILENLDGRKICFPNGFSDQLKGLNEHLYPDKGLLIFQ